MGGGIWGFRDGPLELSKDRTVKVIAEAVTQSLSDNSRMVQEGFSI